MYANENAHVSDVISSPQSKNLGNETEYQAIEDDNWAPHDDKNPERRNGTEQNTKQVS